MNNKNLIWIVIVVVAGFLIFQSDNLPTDEKKEAGETFQRAFDNTQMFPGESFTVTYTATSSEFEWFVGFTDIVSCGNDVESFLFGEGNEPTAVKTKVFTAPSSGTCTFTNGFYGFTGLPVINLGDDSIEVCQHDDYLNCNSGDVWYFDSCNRLERLQDTCDDLISNGAWGAYSCDLDFTQRTRTRMNTVESPCSAGQQICGTTGEEEVGTESCTSVGYCEPDSQTCETTLSNAGDDPIDGCVSFDELLAYANNWVAKTGSPVPVFEDVIGAANLWVGRNKERC